MEKVVIHATRRTVTGKKVGALRRAGHLPAVIYGHHLDATPILLDLHDATKALHGLTASSLVTIELEGTEHAALVREKQRNYIQGTLLHVDFQAVSLTEKIRAAVLVELTGTAPAIKEFNGIFVHGLSQVEVEALPNDLPERITVDVSGLSSLGDGIYVRDLQVSDKVAILSDPEEMIAIVTSGEIAETEEGEETPSASEPEIIERGKKEEAEE
ncbi:MAG: 50S ribosomal protein L25 [Chloroflexi bacterium]|jgi:large subunit ribosomal protein L25|nr:50S ribosomal protein L25 [Chloroflexota bacterium]